MSQAKSLPRLRSEVNISSVNDGEFVVKDKRTRAYFRIGEQEQFLLQHLDGVSSGRSIRKRFEEHFGERINRSELKAFVEMLRSRDLLESTTPATPGESNDASDYELNGQSWLFFRLPILSPDKLLARLEPYLRFIWTVEFFWISLAVILAAGGILWTEREDLVSRFPQAMRWETIAIIYLTLVFVTTIHEFAHGLTCKHYGGDVHEMGALMIFFMPCFYCDVTDAWLIPKKNHRLWVTLAGGYADLCVWAAAVFLWHVTIPDSLLHYISQVVLTTCGTRVFLNLNPFLRLDGYYLLSDWLEIPNLRVRATDYFMAHIRWLFWGASRPEQEERGHWLIAYGLTMWVVAIVTLDIIAVGIYQFILGQFGWTGALLSCVGMMFVSRRVFKGLLTSEFINMLMYRHCRTAVWASLLFGIPTALYWLPLEHSATGDVLVRSGQRVEIHASVGGFLRDISIEEGSEVKTGTVLGRIQVPDLESLIVRKQADITECEATLDKLRAGPRVEEVNEQEARIKRSMAWVEMAKDDLANAKVRLEHSLLQLDQVILQSETELEFAEKTLVRAQSLYERGAFAGEQLRAEQKRVALLKSRVAQAHSEKQSRIVEGVRSAEAELARREKELADSKSTLSLLKAGSRPEDVSAELAKLARLQEELRFLTSEQQKQQILSPAKGVISTPRMAEKTGLLMEKGALICVVEDMSTLSVEIEVDEDSINGVEPGQDVELRIRALPFETFYAKVEKIAPSASIEPTETRSKVTVLCRVENEESKLKAGMTGAARISRGTKLLGTILAQRVMKEFRTEFWW